MKTGISSLKHRGIFSAIVLATLLVSAAASAQQSPTYTGLTDPGLAGGPNGRGSRLGAYDSVLIEAPVSKALPNNPVGAAVCYSVGNQNGSDYFVPWNTGKEWSSFLDAIGAGYQLGHAGIPLAPLTTMPTDSRWVRNVSISACCPEQKVGVICQGAGGDISSNAELGYRVKDTASGPIGYWGAEGDVYGPVYAAQASGDSSINFQVTFVCSAGEWIKTHAQGSCIPVDGQCAAGTGQLQTLPSDLTTLCATGSVFAGFTDNTSASTSGPWRWTCNGTPGRSNATCSSGGNNGACGTQNGQPFDGAGGLNGPHQGWGGDTPSNNLCANGTTASAVTGPDFNTFQVANTDTGEGITTYKANLFHWTCSGTGGSQVVAQCSAPDSAGICAPEWYVSYGKDGDTSTRAPTLNNFLCLEGVPTAISYGINSWNGLLSWNWQCTNGSNDIEDCAVFDSNAPQPGQCGSADGSTVYSSTTAPRNNRLCDSSSSLLSPPVFVAGNNQHPEGYWTWSCQGNNGGTIAQCSADFMSAPAQCGPWVAYLNPPTNPNQLCVTGTPVLLSSPASTPYVWNNGGYWIWQCQGSSGDPIDCNAPVIWNGTCGPAAGVTSSGQPSNDLCGWGSWPAGVVQLGSNWTWFCLGNNGGSTIACTAPVGAPPPSPPVACGNANGQSTTTQPSTDLCTTGAVATNITRNTNGTWTWTCESSNNASSPVACSAPNPTPSGPGVCGTANNKSVPDVPNTNLCVTGQASTVTGQGPWIWSCLGTGSYTGTDDHCSANICTSEGTFTSTVTTSTVSKTISGCTANVYATYTETDSAIPSNAPVTLTWNDPANTTFSKVIVPTQLPPPYCTPRFRSPTSISNVTVFVTKTGGSCPSVPAVDAGGTVTYTPTNITLTN